MKPSQNYQGPRLFLLHQKGLAVGGFEAAISRAPSLSELKKSTAQGVGAPAPINGGTSL